MKPNLFVTASLPAAEENNHSTKAIEAFCYASETWLLIQKKFSVPVHNPWPSCVQFQF